MNANNTQTKKKDKFLLVFLIVILCSILGFGLVKFGKQNYEEIQIKYKEKSDIDYKVYLKENDFFENEYLGMNETYITSLIDHLDINFNYTLELSDKSDGKYSYYIKGIISANQANGGTSNYWKKEYVLSETKDINYKGRDKIEIASNVVINYQDYNSLLNSFKQEYGLAVDGNLKVILVIVNHVTNEKIERDLLKESDIELNIPLTSLTIEVPIDAKGKTAEGFLVDEKIVNNTIIYKISKLSGYLLFGLGAISIGFLIVIGIKRESVYQRKLRKIFKTYDGILVEVNSLPELKNFNIISVKNFEELIDAHSEIRKPINFVKKINGVSFLLLNENIAWEYTLKRDLINSKKN